MGTSHWVRTTVSRMSSVSPGVASRPFGMSAHVRRPVVLMLVFGIFLMIVGVTATAQAAMVSAHFSTNTLSSIVGTDTALVRAEKLQRFAKALPPQSVGCLLRLMGLPEGGRTPPEAPLQEKLLTLQALTELLLTLAKDQIGRAHV